MNIILIGHPRSGTNSLVEILRCQPGLTVVNEPFCEEHASWNPSNSDYLARLNSGESFSALIDELFNKFNGIKELSYQLTGDTLRQLVHRPGVRVVTLRRRNLLQVAVSFLLAERTGIWKRWDADAPPAADHFGTPYPAVGLERVGGHVAPSLNDRYQNLDPLEVDVVQDRMFWTAQEIARIDEAVAGLETLQLVYEDLYLGTRESKQRQVASLWKFLDLPHIDSSRIEFFLSDAVRQAGRATYGQVPNIAKIEAALGSDMTGHLRF
ncbi:hypothetical protein [Streptomyces sp. NPDC005953]|uniref:hypothetical protein n=1 Tax=Streptomyces sp. NPDC005953 TaxID=3156719 RepID=UPI0033F44E3C